MPKAAVMNLISEEKLNKIKSDIATLKVILEDEQQNIKDCLNILKDLEKTIIPEKPSIFNKLFSKIIKR